MAKVTSKLQVTVPKAVAARFGIEPGDDITWEAAGEAIRIVPGRKRAASDPAERLRRFDQATARQRARQAGHEAKPAAGRGWTREELYDRGRPR